LFEANTDAHWQLAYGLKDIAFVVVNDRSKSLENGWGVGGGFNYATNALLHNNSLHFGQMEDMRHIILTALARLMSTADASAQLVEIQGRRCQFFSTLNLDLQMTASIIEALKLAAVGYLFPFSYTLKFRVTVSTQQTALGYMPGVRFSVNYASAVPYFFAAIIPCL
jgi:hypothetical protein